MAITRAAVRETPRQSRGGGGMSCGGGEEGGSGQNAGDRGDCSRVKVSVNGRNGR